MSTDVERGRRNPRVVSVAMRAIMTARAFTPAGRYSPLGPVGIPVLSRRISRCSASADRPCAAARCFTSATSQTMASGRRSDGATRAVDADQYAQAAMCNYGDVRVVTRTYSLHRRRTRSL